MWFRWFHRDALIFYVLFGLVYIVFLSVLPDAGYDKYFWITWTQDILTNGLGRVYPDPEVDNHPLVLYLLTVFSWFFDHPEQVGPESVNWLKALVLPFDLLTLVVVLHVLKRTGSPMTGVLVFFLNPAFWYNTVVWGQVDSIHTFFAFAALIYAERGHWKWSMLLMLVAINFKLQAIIFLPLVIILCLPFVMQKGWREVGMQLLLLVLAQSVILSPFILSGELGPTLRALAGRSIDHYPVLSRNAYNIWYLLVDDPFHFPDGHTVCRAPLKYWGMAMFAAASSMVLLPLFLAVNNGAFENLKRSERLGTIFQVAALVTLAFFLFNTQMHERYVHPAVLFSGMFMLLAQRPIVHVLVSVGYLLNLEAVMRFLRYADPVLGVPFNHQEWFIFHPQFIAVLFFIAFLWGSFEFYRTFFSFKNNTPEAIITT